MEGKDPRAYYLAKYQNLEDLPGVGPATASELRANGYRTVESIAIASLREMVQSGIGEDTAQKIITAARKTISSQFETASELAVRRSLLKKLTTGASNLDRLFNGGLETQSITEFYAEFGGGKSQICQQLCVTVQLPEEKGGLDGGALYIDTEQVFRPERVSQMAEALGLNPSDVLKRIVFAEAYSSDHQMILLDRADEIIKEHNIRLIIVDSLTGQFRAEYLGRENLAPRQQKLNQHLHKLLKLTRAFDAVAVVTNQVSSTPDTYAPGSQTPQAVGGNIVGHASHTRVYLKKGRNNLRIATITASPFLPEGGTPIRITDRGIESDEEV